MQMGLGAVARVAAVTHKLTGHDALADRHDRSAASQVTQRHHPSARCPYHHMIPGQRDPAPRCSTTLRQRVADERPLKAR